MTKIFKKHIGKISIAVIFCLLQMVAMVSSERAKGMLIDLVMAGELSHLKIEFLKYIFFIALMLFLGYLYGILRLSFIQDASHSLRDAFFRSFLNMSVRKKFKLTEGVILTKYSKEITQIEQGFFVTLTMVVEMGLTIIFVLLAFLLLNPKLAIFSALILLLPIFVPKYFEQKLEFYSKNKTLEAQSHLSKFTAWLNSFELIKNFAIEKKIESLFDLSNTKYKDILFNHEKMQSKNTGISFLVSLGAQTLIIILTGYFVLTGNLSVGEFVMISSLTASLRVPTYWISTLFQMIISTRPVRKSVFEFIHSSKQEFAENKLSEQIEPMGADFIDVSYSYNNGEPVLNGLNLKFLPKKIFYQRRIWFGQDHRHEFTPRI